MPASGRTILSSVTTQPITMSTKSYYDALLALLVHASDSPGPIVITGTILACLYFARLLFRLARSKRKILRNGSDIPSSLRKRLRRSVSERTTEKDPQPAIEHQKIIKFLLKVVSFIKQAIWDSLLLSFLSWTINIVAVIFAIIFSFVPALISSLKRKKLKVCVATSLQSSHNLQLEHAEATEFNRNKDTQTLSPYSPAFMVPSALSFDRTRKSLVLDLDETLVHSQFKLTEHCDLRLEVRVDDYPAVFYVSKRPYLDVFLRTVAQWYDVVIYTASLQKYGDPLITVLDAERVIKRRIFRQDCIKRNGNFVKDLTIVNPNLADVLIVDNSPSAYSIQPANAVPIEAWYHDQNDEELLNLLPLLHAVACLNDVRSLLDLRLTRGMLAGRNRSRNAVR